jgi:Protein of unknown function (DUF3237)
MTQPTLLATDPPSLEFAFDVELRFENRMRFGPVPAGGFLGFVTIAGGTISGPLLNGRVIPYSGCDYARMRSDGVVELNAHYLFEAADGTPIYVHNQGYGRAKSAALAAGEEYGHAELDEHYFRVTPRFQAPEGRHDWMTRVVFLGRARRYKNPDRTAFRYFVVR